MNVIVIYEYRTVSANYNIAKKMINEFENRGIRIINACLISGIISNADVAGIEKTGFTVQTKKAQCFLINKSSGEWQQKTKFSKSIYAVFHPAFLFIYF